MEPSPTSRAWRTLVVVLFWAYALLTLVYVAGYALSGDPALALIGLFTMGTPCLVALLRATGKEQP